MEKSIIKSARSDFKIPYNCRAGFMKVHCETIRCDKWMRKQKNFESYLKMYFINDTYSMINVFNRFGFNDECIANDDTEVAAMFPHTYMGKK